MRKISYMISAAIILLAIACYIFGGVDPLMYFFITALLLSLFFAFAVLIDSFLDD